MGGLQLVLRMTNRHKIVTLFSVGADSPHSLIAMLGYTHNDPPVTLISPSPQKRAQSAAREFIHVYYM